MGNKKLGVIDLGTNTFHLLIAEVSSEGNIITIFRQRIFVQLAEETIERIGIAAYERALNALISFASILKKYEVIHVRAFGTAALRTASNGLAFVKEVKIKTNISIQLISGKEEARLIHRGVNKALPLGKEKSLIMDIGGGSVEFILANENGIIWAESFPIGVAVLFKKFHQNDPITDIEIERLHKFLHKQLAPLLHIHQNHQIKNLIGASGTFDVLEVLLVEEKEHSLHSFIDIKDFERIYLHFLYTTLKERLVMEKLPKSRANLIIVALILIEFIVKNIPIQKIAVSSYAMKEGILLEMNET